MLTVIATITGMMVAAHAQDFTPTPVPTTMDQLTQTVAWLYQQMVNQQIAGSNIQGQLNNINTGLNAVRANPVLALGPYCTFNAGKQQQKPVVVFTGVNIRVTQGILTNY